MCWQVYREGKWEQLPGDAIVPGDLVSIGRPSGMLSGWPGLVVKNLRTYLVHAAVVGLRCEPWDVWEWAVQGAVVEQGQGRVLRSQLRISGLAASMRDWVQCFCIVLMLTSNCSLVLVSTPDLLLESLCSLMPWQRQTHGCQQVTQAGRAGCSYVC